MSQPTLSHNQALRSVNRLRRIIDAAKLLNSTIDLDELTAIVLKMVREEVGIDRGTVFLVDSDRQELHSLVAQDVDGTGITLPVGSGIAGTVAVTGSIIDISNAYADARFNPSVDTVLQYRTKDVFCMPIVNRERQIVGVLELLNRAAPFQEDDLDFLRSVSVHIGIALGNASMHRQLLEKRRMEQELMLARGIQENLCPALPGSCGGVQIASSSTMCEAVGGDYLDFHKLADNRFILMLGDVSGKGIGAALVMTSLHATCRALLRHMESLEQIAQVLNETLVETTGAQTYVTLIAVLVDSSSRKLHCVRAGHLPPLLFDSNGNSQWLDHGGGLPIGLFQDLKLTADTYDVPQNSTLVLYSDGITEGENAAGEHFGANRLSAVVRTHLEETATGIHHAIRNSLEAFAGERQPSDDSTLVVLKF